MADQLTPAAQMREAAAAILEKRRYNYDDEFGICDEWMEEWAEIAAEIRALPYLPMQGAGSQSDAGGGLQPPQPGEVPASGAPVPIKPLRWSTKCHDLEEHHPAKTYAAGIGGRYCVDSTGADVLLWDAYDPFSWTQHQTVKAAKAAAQADYEARILAALEFAPAPPVGTDEARLASEILHELKRARAKFPGKNVTFAALVEEVGELATATFEEGRDRVRQEAVQVAVMAMRMILDGDHTYDAWRESKGLDPLILAPPAEEGLRMGALVRYHGGKVRLADKIVGLFPGHDAYVEPFGGGAAVLIAKPRSRLEVYNDLDGDMVTLFRVLRDQPDALASSIAMTPFAREEHQQSYLPAGDDLERARRVLIRSHFGHGSSGIHRATGFRAAGMRAGTLPVHGWMTLPDTVREAAERMRGVVIERRPAVQVMQAHDAPSTVHYVDPPYLPETRDRGRDYRHEMTRADHVALLDALRTLSGAVVLSGYASSLYDEALHEWRRIEVKAMADRGAKRIEVVWCNFQDIAPLFSPAEEG